MPFLILIGGALVLAALFGPSLWARSVLNRYAVHRPDFPGTGGELARHLLDTMDMQEVSVERTDGGDRYSPPDRAVRLSKDHYDGASLSAIVVAAHEVGHAMQDRDRYVPLRTRTRLAGSITAVERVGAAVIFAAPVLGLLSQSPAVGLFTILAGIATMASSVVFHLVTLPVEFDASFNRALPLLDRGGYVPPQDVPAARRILLACALTYVAASLASLLNLYRWIRLFR